MPSDNEMHRDALGRVDAACAALRRRRRGVLCAPHADCADDCRPNRACSRDLHKNAADFALEINGSRLSHLYVEVDSVFSNYSTILSLY